jgi:mono/diheme cytochrome c family protein
MAVALGLALPLMFGAWTSGARAQLISRDVPTPDIAERGRQAFTVSCGFCHGIDARGGEGGPDLVRSEMMLNDEGGDLLGPFLEVGRPDAGMPGFALTEAEVRDLAGYVRAQSQAVINRNLYEIQNVLTGDAERGREYFNGEGGCSGCHSPTGDLAGVGSRFDGPDLLARFIYPGRGGRGGPARPRTVRVESPETGTVEGTLESIDDFNVALRTGEGRFRSFRRTADLVVEVRNPYQAHIDLMRRYTDGNIHDLVTYLATLR